MWSKAVERWRRVRRTAVGAALRLLVLLVPAVVAACQGGISAVPEAPASVASARPQTSSPTSRASSAPSGAAPTRPLPLASFQTPPPVSVLYPDLYDERGCLRYTPDPDLPRECDVPPVVAPGEVPPLAGVGGSYRHFTAELRAGRVLVVEQSVATATTGRWAAAGVVRNETTAPVGRVVVGARLIGDAGDIAALESTVPVDPLRPGEPAPFRLESDVPVDLVRRVEWRVTPLAARPLSRRELLVEVFWRLPFGHRERIENALHVDPVSPPMPFVAAGQLIGYGRERLAGADVVFAWYDADGRVIHSEMRQAGSADPDPRAFPRLVGDWSVSVGDPIIAPRLIEAPMTIWAVGR